MEISRIKLLPLFRFLYAYIFIIIVVSTIKKYMLLPDVDFYSFATIWFAIGIILKALLLLIFGAYAIGLKEFDIVKEDWGDKYSYGLQIDVKEEFKEKEKRS